MLDHIKLASLYPFPYILSVKIFSREGPDVFGITAHVFRSLFLKTCPLFGQILITCVKCSCFSPSFYRGKMRSGRSWKGNLVF